MQRTTFANLIASATLLGAAVAMSGCATGSAADNEGIKKFVAGDYVGARDIFAEQNRKDPNDPYAQFNLAAAQLKLGQTDTAIQLYHQVAISGRDTLPKYHLEPHADGVNLHKSACDHLSDLRVPDTNCP